MNTAAESGLAEVQFGQLAESKSVPRSVHDFAARMVTDHTQLNNQLMQLAQSLQFTPPTALSPQDQQTYQRLQGLNGRAFVNAYMPNQIQAHEAAIQLFQNEAQNGNNPQLRNLAQQSVPILQQHLEMAQRIYPVRR